CRLTRLGSKQLNADGRIFSFLEMLIRCVGDCRGLVILRASFAPRAVARICGAVRLVWPKTGFRSSRMPAMRKRRVIRRMAVQEADMAELLGTSSVCRAG